MNRIRTIVAVGAMLALGGGAAGAAVATQSHVVPLGGKVAGTG